MLRHVHPLKIHRDEQGMASFFITMVMIFIVSLIVLGLAIISRREQRLSLDRQLSTQAFYSAESGINDAQSDITNALINNTQINDKTSCSTGSGIYSNLNSPKPTINSSTNTSYSCLLVTTQLKTLVYNPVSQSSGRTTLVDSSAGSIGQINISWQDSVLPSAPTFPCEMSGSNAFTPVPPPGRREVGYQLRSTGTPGRYCPRSCSRNTSQRQYQYRDTVLTS